MIIDVFFSILMFPFQSTSNRPLLDLIRMVHFSRRVGLIGFRCDPLAGDKNETETRGQQKNIENHSVFPANWAT